MIDDQNEQENDKNDGGDKVAEEENVLLELAKGDVKKLNIEKAEKNGLIHYSDPRKNSNHYSDPKSPSKHVSANSGRNIAIPNDVFDLPDAPDHDVKGKENKSKPKSKKNSGGGMVMMMRPQKKIEVEEEEEEEDDFEESSLEEVVGGMD